MPSLQISRSRSRDCSFQVMLGGVRVFGRDQKTIDQEVNRISNIVLNQMSENFTLSRAILRKLVVTDLGEYLDDRLLSAILGRLLRLGQIESVPVESVNGVIYRVYLSADSTQTFRTRVEEVRTILQHKGWVKIKSIQRKFFPGEEWGTWSSAEHLCARLVFAGAARFTDRFSVEWPEGIEDAGH